MRFSVTGDMKDAAIPQLSSDKNRVPDDTPKAYLDKIVGLCHETNTELLFVYVPGFLSSDKDRTDTLKCANWASRYAA